MKFRQRVKYSLRQLKKNENILEARDGQIEAKGYRVALKNHIRKLYFQFAKKYYSDASIFTRLSQFCGILACPSKYFMDSEIDFALLLINNLIFASSSFNNVGNAYLDLGYAEEAIFYYEKSIELKQREIRRLFTSRALARTWRNKGRALASLKRHEEAIAACKKLLKLTRNSIGRGILLEIYILN